MLKNHLKKINEIPSDIETLKRCLASPEWRLNNLYYIVAKDPQADGDMIIGFKPNVSQQRLIDNLWYRNIIPKSRQLGFTTLSCILALDYALFQPNFQAGIIAHTDGVAEKLFRDKVMFAYERLPEAIRSAMPLKKRTTREIVLQNDSSILVSTSMRSGTINFLHVSEMGKICARFPQRAKEIVTGSLPAVPTSGIAIIESTAEGREGAFYDMTIRAKAIADSGNPLTIRNWKLHFYPWYDGPDYQIDPTGVVITEKDHEYFDSIESSIGIELTMRQRAWYCVVRDSDFSGNQMMMYQEYPSTIDECFYASSEGCYFTKQVAQARKENRIKSLPILNSVPCWTFWDIGNSDGTAIWVIQKVGHEFRCIHFYEAWGEPFEHAVKWLQSLKLVWEEMYLPHDAAHVRQASKVNQSPEDMLRSLMPGVRWSIVPRIGDVNWGIQQTRDIFPLLWFDAERCKDGLVHIEAYKRKWSERQECWSSVPDKSGGHSEAADALRQLAQAYAGKLLNISMARKTKSSNPNWRTA
jgi:hypothetical protein